MFQNVQGEGTNKGLIIWKFQAGSKDWLGDLSRVTELRKISEKFGIKL